MTNEPYGDAAPDSVEQAVTNVISNIRAEMGRTRLRQADLAEALHVAQQAVSARLNGHTDLSLPDLAVLADLFEVPLSVLVADPRNLRNGQPTVPFLGPNLELILGGGQTSQYEPAQLALVG